MSIIPAASDALIISIEYDPAGQWCDMWDNQVIGWETGGTSPQPIVIGTLPPPAGASDPIKSPQWVSIVGAFAVVPNLWRGELADFFDWLSTNNGAQRQLRGSFVSADALNTFANWAQDNPTMVWPGP